MINNDVKEIIQTLKLLLYCRLNSATIRKAIITIWDRIIPTYFFSF